MALTKVTYSMINGAPVNVLDYGADPTGVSNSTAAINAAIATGQSVYFPRGTYLTTGGHALTYPSNQMFFGDGYGASIIKKSSGTATIFDIPQETQCSFSDLTIDANNLGGTVFMWRAHYSTITNVDVRNVGGTSYGFHISGSNLCLFENLNVQNSYGGFKIDQSTDPLPVNPSYGMLYSTFNKCAVDIRSGGESALFFNGSIVGNISFNDFYIEVAVSNTTKAAIYFDTGSSNVNNINFTQMSAETFGGLYSVVDFKSAVIYNVSFNQCRFAVSAAMVSAIIKAVAVEGLDFIGCSFDDQFTSIPEVFDLTSCSNVNIQSSNNRITNNYVFVRDNGNNSFINLLNNVSRLSGTARNDWDTSTYVSVQNSDAKQTFENGNGQTPNVSFNNVPNQHSQSTCGYVTVVDDGFYDIFGDGGTTNPLSAFSGVITIQGLPTNRSVVSTTANNFATFYAQTSNNSNAQTYTAITVGSNVEIDVLVDGLATNLSITTDGKLGVQIGGGSATAPAVRIYNRTGASISLNVDVKAFK
jgi:hypothetical protein